MSILVIFDDEDGNFWQKGTFKHAEQLISSKQNVWKTTITACLDEFKHIKISQNAPFNYEVFFSHGRWMQQSPTGVATAQPPSPQPVGSPVWMTSLSRWDKYHFGPQRGSVELEGGTSTVNNSSSVGQTPLLLLCGWSELWLSEQSVKFALSLPAQA